MSASLARANDLDLIASGKPCHGPGGARDDHAIDGDRDAARLRRDLSFEKKRRQGVGHERLDLAVHADGCISPVGHRGSLRWHDPDRFDGCVLSRGYRGTPSRWTYDGDYRGARQGPTARPRTITLARSAAGSGRTTAGSACKWRKCPLSTAGIARTTRRNSRRSSRPRHRRSPCNRAGCGPMRRGHGAMAAKQRRELPEKQESSSLISLPGGGRMRSCSAARTDPRVDHAPVTRLRFWRSASHQNRSRVTGAWSTRGSVRAAEQERIRPPPGKEIRDEDSCFSGSSLRCFAAIAPCPRRIGPQPALLHGDRLWRGRLDLRLFLRVVRAMPAVESGHFLHLHAEPAVVRPDPAALRAKVIVLGRAVGPCRAPR